MKKIIVLLVLVGAGVARADTDSTIRAEMERLRSALEPLRSLHDRRFHASPRGRMASATSGLGVLTRIYATLKKERDEYRKALDGRENTANAQVLAGKAAMGRAGKDGRLAAAFALGLKLEEQTNKLRDEMRKDRESFMREWERMAYNIRLAILQGEYSTRSRQIIDQARLNKLLSDENRAVDSSFGADLSRVPGDARSLLERELRAKTDWVKTLVQEEQQDMQADSTQAAQQDALSSEAIDP